MGTVKIKLASPVESDGSKIEAIEIREAELDDLIAAEDVKGSDLARFRFLLARVAGISEEVAGKLKARDLKAIGDKAGHLLGNEAADGGTSPS